jgi:phospho-N-acetylmuramoyl-pentapeptide-transferase
MEVPLIKILLPAILTFVIGVLITPLVSKVLYSKKVWKKTAGKMALGGKEATEFNRLKGEDETKTPRMGGIVIWGSTLITITVLAILSFVFNDSIFSDLNFLSRSQTWIPIATLLVGAFIGFVNDFYDIKHEGKGLRLSVRLLFVTVLASLIGWWFYDKLEVVTVGVPFGEPLYIGWLIIPFFVIIANAIYASGVIDGIDGLSGGVFTFIFTAYATIALIQEQFDLAAFLATLTGGILAFLWFNIPPARFWMTETGSMALTLTLGVTVLMTDSVGGGHGILLLPIIGLPLVVTVGSNLIQIIYRKATGGKKLLRIAPLHHHFEAIGWPSYKVTMRYWVISMMCAVMGVMIAAVA